eukprot:9986733-Heterocapsa_arctica.AAC.1
MDLLGCCRAYSEQTVIDPNGLAEADQPRSVEFSGTYGMWSLRRELSCARGIGNIHRELIGALRLKSK